MQIGMIGATGHTNYVLEGLKRDEETSVVGIAPGPAEGNTGNLVEELKSIDESPKEFENYENLINELKPDVVTVACHFNNHAEVSHEALERGINVFVEKPVATRLKELNLVRNAYEGSSGALATMFGSRYEPYFETAKELVREGAIGDIRLMHAQKSYILGNRPPFYKSRKSYGGTIPWVGIHGIDWLHWFSEKKFKSVFATHSSKFNKDHGELESTALCHFVLPGEIIGSVSIDYLRPREAPTHGDDRLRIAGDKGVLETRNNEVYLINHDIEGIRKVPINSNRNSIFKDFLEGVRGNAQCKITAETSFYVTEAALKARSSADKNEVERI